MILAGRRPDGIKLTHASPNGPLVLQTGLLPRPDATLSRIPAQLSMNRRALLTACGVGFAFSANYTNHAPMLAVLREHFALSQGRAGLITTAIFLAHALMQVPGGQLADRFGPLRVLILALAWVALANIALGLSTNY